MKCSYAHSIDWSVQVGLNIQLGVALGHGLRAAFIAFLVAAIPIFPFTFSGPSYGESLRKAATEGRWIIWFGGPMGATCVALSTVLSPLLGASLYTIFSVLGSLGMSLLVDHFGLLSVPLCRTSPMRAFGVGLVLVGALLAQDYEAKSGAEIGWSVVYSIGAVIAGAVLPIQAGLNGMLSRYTGAAKSVFVSMMAGVFVLAITAAFTFIETDWQFDIHSAVDAPKFIGGIVGTLFVLAGVVLAPRLGMAPFFILSVSGQLLAALVIDHIGTLGFPQKDATVRRILAVVISIFGGFVANVASYRAQAAQSKLARLKSAADVDNSRDSAKPLETVVEVASSDATETATADSSVSEQETVVVEMYTIPSSSR